VHYSTTPSSTEPYAVCPTGTSSHPECSSVISPARPQASLAGGPGEVTSSYSGGGVGGGYDPADLRSAYDLPSTSAGSEQTVAIVDAYDDPNAESDLATYRSEYGISACTTSGGCFRKINQNGGTEYPTAEPKWAVEISLDLDMVSAVCPKCHILLVEANSNSFSNLNTAESQAVTQGATEISNSWGSEQFSGETANNTYYKHLGIPITFSAGDHGYEVEYPAASPYVIAVGGTSLSKAENARGWSETAWSGTGSGCSAYETKPVWQKDTGCTHRTNNDVSAVADPNTPVSVYDSYSESGWLLVGGTSAASPITAATMALTAPATRYLGAAAFYDQAYENGTGALDDVVSGSNGSCGNYLCNAGSGYDGPTGLGTPYGVPAATIPSTEGEISSSWAVRDANSRSQYVYYVNSAHEIWNWNWTSLTGWGSYGLGGKVATGTTAAVVRESSNPTYGSQYVYFVNSSSELANWNWTSSSGWTSYPLGGKVATSSSPTAVRDPNTGDQYVYFVNSNNEIANWNWTPSTSWTSYALGGKVATGSSPAVVREQSKSNGSQYVYFVNSNKEIANWNWTSSTSWTSYALGGKVATGTSPAVVRNPSNGDQYVYFVNSNNEIANWNWTPSTGWTSYALGGKVATGMSPAVVRDPSTGDQYVYFVNSNNEIANWNWTPSTGWTSYPLGGKVATGTSPAVLRDVATGSQYVYYVSSSGAIWSWEWTPVTAAWTAAEL
jgi:subtilase family serine protease